MLVPDHRPLMAILVSLLAAGAILLSSKRPNWRETWSCLAAGIKFVLVLSLVPHVLANQVVEAAYVELLPGLALHLRADLFGLIFALSALRLPRISSPFFCFTKF
jgi:multicomponent Na+:H+ antiporter subunit D